MKIRKAGNGDIDFLCEAIIEAEKSGSNVLSYARIFGLEDEEFRAVLREMLEEDLDGQELCISGFLIAEEDGRPAAAVCGWIESAGGMSSGQLKASLLMQYLDTEKLRTAAPILEQVNLQRSGGTLQLESIYTAPAKRGKGLASELINAHIASASAPEAEIIVSSGNLPAIRAYQKAGFIEKEQRSSESEDLLKYLPHKGKIKLHRQI